MYAYDDQEDPNALRYFPPTTPTPAPTNPRWTDPDNAPPSWLYDPNAAPPSPTEPGAYWSFDHTAGMWVMRNSPRPAPRPTDAPTANDPIPPYTDTTGGGGDGWDGMDFGEYDASWQWPQFNAPRFSFDQGDPFTFNKFAAPSMQEAEQEPGYAFARDQGRKMLETSAAGRGLLRSGGTLKDLIQFGNTFAEQNYGNVFNRSKDVFNTNERNRFDAHNANFGNRLRGAESVFDRNYKASWDEFSPKFEGSKMEFSDRFNRWRAKLDALTQMSQPVE